MNSRVNHWRRSRKRSPRPSTPTPVRRGVRRTATACAGTIRSERRSVNGGADQQNGVHQLITTGARTGRPARANTVSPHRHGHRQCVGPGLHTHVTLGSTANAGPPSPRPCDWRSTPRTTTPAAAGRGRDRAGQTRGEFGRRDTTYRPCISRWYRPWTASMLCTICHSSGTDRVACRDGRGLVEPQRRPGRPRRAECHREQPDDDRVHRPDPANRPGDPSAVGRL